MTPEFTTEELQDLAWFVCERVDMMQQGIDNPKVTSSEYKAGCQETINQLKSLDTKLRPYYTKGGSGE